MDESQSRVCKHVFERLVAFLTRHEQAHARRASKVVCQAVSTVCMENLLRATVLQHSDGNDGSLVIVATTVTTAEDTIRVLQGLPSFDVALAWSGGLMVLYEELRLRFPLATIGISTRLMFGLCPSPSAASLTMPCMLLNNVDSLSPLYALECVVIEDAAASNLTVPALSAPFPMLCLDGAKPEQVSRDVENLPLSTFSSSACCSANELGFFQCRSLASLSFANLPWLQRVRDCAFFGNAMLTTVELTCLPSLRMIGFNAFNECTSLTSVSLIDLPCLESIGFRAFAGCEQLLTVVLRDLSSLRAIGASAFYGCKSLQSVHVANVLLESIGEYAFFYCSRLSNIDLLCVKSLRSIGDCAFFGCASLSTCNLASLPCTQYIGDRAFHNCGFSPKMKCQS